jgi:hypothetical protein
VHVNTDKRDRRFFLGDVYSSIGVHPCLSACATVAAGKGVVQKVVLKQHLKAGPKPLPSISVARTPPGARFARYTIGGEDAAESEVLLGALSHDCPEEVQPQLIAGCIISYTKINRKILI